MPTLVAYLLGFLFGAIIANILRFEFRSFGVLRIDHSNPEKDVYRLEIDKLDSLSSKKKIVLKIDNNADLSQK